MVEILVTSSAPGSGEGPTPLLRSLHRQTDDRWRLSKTNRVSPGDDPDLFVLCVDPEAELRDDAVAILADAITKHPLASAFYTDIRVGSELVRRPAWSPTRAMTQPAACQPIVVRAGAVSSDALTNPTVAALELARSEAIILHIPAPVVSCPDRPAASGVATLIDAHLGKIGVSGRTVPGPSPGTYEIRPSRRDRRSLTVVVPTAGARDDAGNRFIDSCLDGLDDATWPDLQVVIVVGDEFDGDAQRLASAPNRRLLQRPPGRFNFAEASNLGLLAANTELVLFLNDDTTPIDSDWLDRLAVHLGDPTVGAVGAMMLYPGGSIQHAGVNIDDARPLHPFVGWQPRDIARFGGDVAHDAVAVTAACLMSRRAELLRVGGFWTGLPLSFNDVDLCLKLRRRGLRIIIEPGATLIHHETASREAQIDGWEWDRYIGRWGEIDDPWYHPGYERPDEPDSLNLNVNHIEPSIRREWLTPRGTSIHPAVHHVRERPPK